MRLAYCAALMFAATISLATPSRSWAAFTNVNPPATGEDSRLQILSHVYGGTFITTSPGSLDYTNGTITATRIEDIASATFTSIPTSLQQTPEAGPAGNDDQLWQGEFDSFTAHAIFALYDQTFGYYDGATGGTFHSLLTPTGKNYALLSNTNLSATVNLTTADAPQVFRWARGGESRTFTSQISDNSDKKDHMITYRINGLNDGFQTWLLLWEDEFPCYSDYDYNDLVVEIKSLPKVDTPEPALITPLGVGLVMGLRSRRTQKPA